MKRMWMIAVGVVIVILLLIVFWKQTGPEPPPPTPRDEVVQSPDSQALAAKPLPGDILLESYASTNSTARKDLRQILRVFDNALILVKQADTRHYATNEDLADFLRGKNRNQTAFVSPNSKLFGKDGRIFDRWGNPLHVHPVSHGKIELRSAGPDGIAWNDDDVLVDSPM